MHVTLHVIILNMCYINIHKETIFGLGMKGISGLLIRLNDILKFLLCQSGTERYPVAQCYDKTWAALS